LFKVNVVEEVDHQNNIGVAAVEAALFVGLAFMATAYIA
jgi:inner membrane protein involved in colicin E2 resistance